LTPGSESCLPPTLRPSVANEHRATTRRTRPAQDISARRTRGRWETADVSQIGFEPRNHGDEGAGYAGLGVRPAGASRRGHSKYDLAGCIPPACCPPVSLAVSPALSACRSRSDEHHRTPAPAGHTFGKERVHLTSKKESPRRVGESEKKRLVGSFTPECLFTVRRLRTGFQTLVGTCHGGGVDTWIRVLSSSDSLTLRGQ
jgi:hypothetical protein